MKPTPFLLLLLLAFAADTWQPFAVDSRVTVQLPGQPVEADLTKLAPGRQVGHVRMWMLRAPEGSYQVMRLPTNVTSLHDTAGRRSFYAGVLTSLLRNQHGQLLTQTTFPTAGGEGVEFKFKALHKGTGKQMIKLSRCLLLDSVTYSFNFATTDPTDTLGLTGAEQRRRFFNSITVKP